VEQLHHNVMRLVVNLTPLRDIGSDFKTYRTETPCQY